MGKVDAKRVGRDLTEGPILTSILIFAFPIILTNLVQQLYSLVDLMIIGHYMGSIGTVGISTGGELADIATPMATNFATAGQILIAQMVGAEKMSDVKRVTGTLITMMLMLSLVFLVIGVVFCVPLLELMNCPVQAMGEARKYMLITCLGYPFIYAYNAVCSVLRGMGDSKRPLYFVIVAAVINIFLDFLFVAVFGWGCAGTAIATVFSQIGSFAAALLYLYWHREQFGFELGLWYFRIEMRLLKVILRVALPECAKSFLVRFSLLWVNSGINAFGIVASATNSVGNKIQKLMQIFLQNLAQGSGAIVGQNLGAGKIKRTEKVVWYTFYLAFVIACILGLISWFLPRQIFSVFTNDPDVIEYGVVFMRIIIIFYFASAAAASFQAITTGSGFTTFNFFLGIFDSVVCRIGLSILFVYVLGMGATGFFWALGLTRVLPGAVVFAYFKSGKWKTRKLLTEQ